MATAQLAVWACGVMSYVLTFFLESLGEFITLEHAMSSLT